MLKFTPPASGSTRLSKDVWQLICEHATQNGNSSTREAIEQLIRRTLGNAQSVPLLESSSASTATTSSALPAPNKHTSAAAALDALLSD